MTYTACDYLNTNTARVITTPLWWRVESSHHL